MGILKNRNFAILFSGQLISTVGNSLFTIALLWYIMDSTNSKGALALTGFALTLPSVAGFFVGVLIDRWKKRSTMILSDSVRALILITLFFISIHAHPSIFLIIGLVLGLQLIGLFFSPSVMALLPELIPHEDIPSAMGLNQSGSAFAQLSGLVGGGAFLAILGAPLLFLSDAITFIISVASLFFIRVTEIIKPKSNSSLAREWWSGLRTIIEYKLILRVVLAACVANFAMAPFDVMLTVWVKGPLHGSALTLGLINGSLLGGIICGGAVLGWITQRVTVKRVLISGFILFGACIAMVGAYPNQIWDMVVTFLSGIAMGGLNGTIGAMAIQVVPKEMRGRIFGTLQALATISMPCGMALFGFLMVHIPLIYIFLLIGLCTVISGLSFFIPIKSELSSMTMSA